MKNIHLLIPIFSLVLYTSSCIKSSNSDTPAQSIVWKMDGGTDQTADTISYIRLLGLNYIFGTKGTTKIFLATNGNAPGNYSTSSANAAFGLTIAGTQYSNSSGALTITSNSNSRLNGSFNAVFIIINVDTVTFTGSFNNISYY